MCAGCYLISVLYITPQIVSLSLNLSQIQSITDGLLICPVRSHVVGSALIQFRLAFLQSSSISLLTSLVVRAPSSLSEEENITVPPQFLGSGSGLEFFQVCGSVHTAFATIASFVVSVSVPSPLHDEGQITN